MMYAFENLHHGVYWIKHARIFVEFPVLVTGSKISLNHNNML